MDKNLEKIITTVAIKRAKSPAKLKLATEIFFSNVKKLMQRDDMPTILIHGFGRLTPTEKKLNRKLLYLKKQLLEGEITKEEHSIEYEKYTKVLDRVRKTKHKRTK